MYRRIKRALGFFVTLVGTLVASPSMLVIALAIKLTSPGPVIFKQKRVGIHRAFFTIYKFRTMRIDAPKDVPTHMLRNPKAAMTPIGGFLRKTSLDELPQLFNILKGDMAVVGPRPALWNQDDLVEAREKVGANDVLPGITGWAQVNGRDELPIPVKAKFDWEYVQRMSFALDMKILLKTVGSVFKSEGVSEGGPEYTGENGERAFSEEKAAQKD